MPFIWNLSWLHTRLATTISPLQEEDAILFISSLKQYLLASSCFDQQLWFSCDGRISSTRMRWVCSCHVMYWMRRTYSAFDNMWAALWLNHPVLLLYLSSGIIHLLPPEDRSNVAYGYFGYKIINVLLAGFSGVAMTDYVSRYMSMWGGQGKKMTSFTVCTKETCHYFLLSS